MKTDTTLLAKNFEMAHSMTYGPSSELAGVHLTLLNKDGEIFAQGHLYPAQARNYCKNILALLDELDGCSGPTQ